MRKDGTDTKTKSIQTVIKTIIAPNVCSQLRSLPKEKRRQIGYAIDQLSDNLKGDVKKLQGDPAGNSWRLRVGEYRILFRLIGDTVYVKEIVLRRDAY